MFRVFSENKGFLATVGLVGDKITFFTANSEQYFQLIQLKKIEKENYQT